MEVDNKSLSAQNALLSKLGISTTNTKTAEPKTELGQSEFLRLMTTQLQNQDPFAPMDNGDFIAQMAQFSSVAGISEMSETMSGIAEQIGQLGILFLSRVILLERTMMVKSTACLSWSARL
jgi:flagellar basal-body rod modification protein FlgD